MTIRDTSVALFAGADAGHYTLPTRLTEMRAGLTRLQQAVDPQPRTADEEHADLLEATVTAAIAAQPLPDTAPIDEARVSERLAADRSDVRVKAAEALAYRLTVAVLEESDEIITSHLRPAFERIMADLRAAVAITSRYDDDPVRALNAPAKERKAFADVPVLVGEQAAIAAARRVLADCGARPTRDVDGEFASVRNIDELWPRQQRRFTPRPWGSGAEGTTWLLRHGAELWLPTPAEQDARYEQVYGEAEREAARRHRIVADMSSGFTPRPRYAQPADAEDTEDTPARRVAQQIERAG